MNPKPEYDLYLEVDASVRKGNPGSGAWAFVACDSWMNVIFWDCKLIPQPITSNEAELVAIENSLLLARDLGYPRKIQVRSDSRTAVRHLTGGFPYTSGDLTRAVERIWKLEDSIGEIDYRWVPRKWNRRADHLTKKVWNSSAGEIRRIDFSKGYEVPNHWQVEEWHLYDTFDDSDEDSVFDFQRQKEVDE